MDIFFDPTVLAGLATLVVLEIVLGIDNLIFIAILSDKVPPHLRQKARVTGLTMALGMRIGMLFGISWLTNLTTPLFYFADFAVSGRDMILILGGLFLLLKATMELHEKLEGSQSRKTGPIKYAGFGSVVAQIVVLDAVFSLDAVITAVGMANHVSVMIVAVCIAMFLMILASNRLMNFVSRHPTVVILCLGFLLMIGFSLIVEGLGYHIPKGYLYAAIGFSVIIEFFNQTAQRNRQKNYEKIDARTRVSQAVLSLLGGSPETPHLPAATSSGSKESELEAFNPQERLMINRVLQLANQQIRSIMTPRHDLYWIDTDDDTSTLEADIKDCPYSTMIVAKAGELDEPAGFILKKDLADMLIDSKSVANIQTILRQPLMIPDKTPTLQALEQMKKSRIHHAFVIDEFGSLEGLVTLTDILEAIAGDIPEDHEPELFAHKQQDDGSIVVNGMLTLQELGELIGEIELPEGEYTTVAGLALQVLHRIPKAGDSFILANWSVDVIEMDGHRISRLRLRPSYGNFD